MKRPLGHLFDELNRKYWRGRLPKYRVIRRGTIRGRYLGLCNDRRRTILVLSTQSEADQRLTLLHEMCHIGRARGHQHGPVFQRRMRRLVGLGEPKILEEVGRYDGTDAQRLFDAKRARGEEVHEMSFREAVLSDLEGAAEGPRWIRHRWATMRRYLAEEYGITPAQVDRFAPWARRKWRELCRGRRYEELARKALETGVRPPPWRE